MNKLSNIKFIVLGILLSCLISRPETAMALVKYDEGRLMIDGIQLLQDNTDPNLYYYIPQFPRIASKEDGSLELLCMKYIGEGDASTNGGIFHALIEFTLPPEVLSKLVGKLQEKIPGATIAGPVPLQQTMKDGEEGLAGFQVISSILTNTGGENPMTNSVITSGFAPLLPGSKAAIAASLNQEGATLLWESVQGPTSDVSIAISGYYEAAVKAYNAMITADVSTVYNHYSRIMNNTEGYTKRELRKISDELIQDQTIKIDVFDRTKALGVKADEMEGLLSLVTDKLVELMFDAEAGWAKKPETEVAVLENQIQGRQKRGWFSKVFGGGVRNEKYVSDNQYVIKKREDIRVNTFVLNLSKSTTIKVPIYTTGNIGGSFFEDMTAEADDRYFRIVNMDDPGFKKREIFFQVDGAFVETFSEILNYVTVSFKKNYGTDSPHADKTEDLVFVRKNLEENLDIKSVTYPRLGLPQDDWLNYQYKISWSMKGNNKTIEIPSNHDQWLNANSPAISLIPPFSKRKVMVDMDLASFKESEIFSANIRFLVILDGEPQAQKNIIYRTDDADGNREVALYCDQGEPIAYQIIWHKKSGTIKDTPKELTDEYLFIRPSAN